MLQIRSALLSAVMFLVFLVLPVNVHASDYVPARPSTTGKLQVRSSELSDINGSSIHLRGVSLHGITWFPDFVNEDLFMQVSKEWQANLIRLPVYTGEYSNRRELCLDLVRKGIDAAIAADMYVIVDWHVLDDPDPNKDLDMADDFFRTVSSEYPDCPNIIWEICNEPNGETTWSEVRNFANVIIPVIRKNCPDSVILIGTPNYCKNLNSPAMNPLEYDNIMYTLHFYAATHKDDLRREYARAKQIGLPVFVSECGLSGSSGSGDLDYDSAASWFSLLEEKGTSFAIWSLSDKNESSALFKPSYDPKISFTVNDLSGCGQWVGPLLEGEDPRSIPEPAPETGMSRVSAFLYELLETEDTHVAKSWPAMALCSAIIITGCVLIILRSNRRRKEKYPAYDDIYEKELSCIPDERGKIILTRLCLVTSVFFTFLYLGWRILFSVPLNSGPLAIAGNLLLLVVEILGFIESVILYYHLMAARKHPLPKIEDDEYPDVDIFIATYNEPRDLLYKTINGCNHLKYPDRSRVHIWLCDDNRRAEMKQLAKEMNIGYFDRPDNKGAKAGNLNHALGLTNSPYVVTLDADMIPKSDFLLKTIPYFVDANKRSAGPGEGKKIRLGLLQTPQCFYMPDVFQFALYSEKTAPNEQDFFYRTIEVAKTSSNSVIYGGSNTVISREALEAIGGFYTGSITEDFATGMLIESKGFVSLATPEPLASGMTPHTYREHIGQRKRWGRGVISTAKQLHLFKQPGLSFIQKLSYLSSVIYWYSPVKNLIYLLSPLFFACFAIPVFKCGWLDLVIYWLPMFIMQDATLRLFSGNSVSLKWSGIYETSVMPQLLLPVIKETFGITTSVFEVTDKTKSSAKRRRDIHSMMPFLILIGLCVSGMIRSVYVLSVTHAMGIVVLLFWLVRNTYFLVMSVFLIDGRDGSGEDVTVIDAEPVTLSGADAEDGSAIEGITTFMTVHGISMFMDEAPGFRIGDKVKIRFPEVEDELTLYCIITSIKESRHGNSCVIGTEILDPSNVSDEYLQVLFDRIPTLPQSLVRDFGIIKHLLRNIAYRILR